MKNKKAAVILVVLMAVISFTCLSLGFSYAYLYRVRVSENSQVINTGNLTATLEYSSYDSFLSSVSDTQGLSLNEYGTLTISKENVYSVYYVLNIAYDINSIPSGYVKEDLIPMEYIRVALFDSNNDLVIGPCSIADLPIESVDVNNHYNDRYILSFGNFSAGNDSETYKLKVWLDNNIPFNYDGGIVYLNMDVTQKPLKTISLYNLSGSVKLDGAAASNAEVILQEGTIKTTTDSSGNFSLSNVPVGTHNVKIIYNEVEYLTTIHVQSGAQVSINATTPASGQIGDYMQNAAFTYYTTPNKIIRKNAITTTSNESVTQSYTVPTSYVITGLESLSVLDISNISISLNSDNTLSMAIGS